MVEKGRVTTSVKEGIVTITGEGDLDLWVQEQFRQALSEAVDSGHEIIVDLRPASFIDTAIVAALVPPAKAMLERASRLKVLVTEGAYPQRVLIIVGFPDIMDIRTGEGESV